MPLQISLTIFGAWCTKLSERFDNIGQIIDCAFCFVPIVYNGL